MARILLTGVRGKTSVPLARLLRERPGVEVLGGSSTPDAVDLEGVRPVRFSWDDPAGWAAALDGAEAVYVVLPERADAPELVGALLARTRPQARVVLLSERRADQVGPDGWTIRAERAVRDSGRRWTILRPSWFMQVFTDRRFYRDDLEETGELAFSSGGRSVAWIDTRDIAAVAEVALLDEGHHGRTYELTGPESVPLARTAELLAPLVGRPVVHREISIEEAVEGTEGFDRDLGVVTFERIHAGVFSDVTDTVEQVTGRPARSLAEFVSDVAQGSSSRSPRSDRR